MRQDIKSYMVVERQSGYIFTIKENAREATYIKTRLELLHGKRLWKIIPIKRDYLFYNKLDKSYSSYGCAVGMLYKKVLMEDRGIMNKQYSNNYELYVNHEVMNAKTIFIKDVEYWRIDYDYLKSLCE